MYEAEIDMSSGAAKRHSHRVLFGAEREEPALGSHSDQACEMGVRLDSTGHHDFAAGVDDAAGLGARVGKGYRDDLFAQHRDVPQADSLRSHDLASTN